MWKQWVNVVLGILVVFFAFTGLHTIRFVIIGAAIAILTAWSALEKQ